MKLSTLLLTACLIAMPVAAHADQIITFEGYPGETIFTTQYTGVDFNGATVLSLADVSLNPSFPPHSGVNVVYNPSGPMTINFSTPVQFFEGYFTYNSGLSITAFDGATAVGSFTGAYSSNYVGSGNPPNELGLVTAADITSVVIAGGGGNNFTLDDAEFTGSINGSATPEPSSLVLLGSGVLGLAGAVRRRFIK